MVRVDGIRCLEGAKRICEEEQRAESRCDLAAFLFGRWVERCAVDRLQLYLGDSVCKSHWDYRLKMPLEERDQRDASVASGSLL